MSNNKRKTGDESQGNESHGESDDEQTDEDKRTLFCANLPDQVTVDLLYELFLQAGPIESVSIPKDKQGRQRTYGFVTYVHLCTIPYALKLYDDVSLFKQKIIVKPKNSNNSNTKDNNSQPSRRRAFDSSDQLRGVNNSFHNFSDRNMQPSTKRSRQEETLTIIDLMNNEMLKNQLASQLAPNLLNNILFNQDMTPQSSQNLQSNNKPYNRNENKNRNKRRGDDQWYHNQRAQQRRRYR